MRLFDPVVCVLTNHCQNFDHVSVCEGTDRGNGFVGISSRNSSLKLAIIFPIMLFLIGCTPKPEPLSYNRDLCHTCKMTLTDIKYGAEVVTKKNKVYKFDDINCMVNFLESGYLKEDEIAFKLVIDYSNPLRGLIPADEAFYLYSDQLRSPMASEVAAFEMQDSLKAMKKKIGGIYLGWGELKTQFK